MCVIYFPPNRGWYNCVKDLVQRSIAARYTCSRDPMSHCHCVSILLKSTLVKNISGSRPKLKRFYGEADRKSFHPSPPRPPPPSYSQSFVNVFTLYSPREPPVRSSLWSNVWKVRRLLGHSLPLRVRETDIGRYRAVSDTVWIAKKRHGKPDTKKKMTQKKMRTWRKKHCSPL